MAITAQSIIDQAEEILQDESNDKWGETDLLGWLNVGQRAIVREKPDANSVREAVLLASGLWQSLPSTGVLLLGTTMNMGTDGATPGVPVTLVERKWMDAVMPTWTTATASATTEHVIYDKDQHPKEFMVYPQSDGTGYIEVFTSKIPADILIAAVISVGDEFAEGLLDYVLFRAFSRDADYVENAQRAIHHWQSFGMIVGRIEANEQENPAKKGQGTM